MQVQPTAQKTVSAHKRKATEPSEPATATKRAAIDVGVRWADRLEMYEGDTTTTTTTTTRDDKENTGAKGPMAPMGPMVDGLDDEITVHARVGRELHGDKEEVLLEVLLQDRRGGLILLIAVLAEPSHHALHRAAVEHGDLVSADLALIDNFRVAVAIAIAVSVPVPSGIP